MKTALLLHRIPLRPIPRLLLPGRPVPPQLLGNPPFHRIIRIRLLQQLSGKRQHRGDLGGRLPLLRLQHAKTHHAGVGGGGGSGAGGVATGGARGDVGVVYFGCECEGGGSEGILWGESEQEVESSALFAISERSGQ